MNHPALAAAILFTRALIREGVSVARGPTVGRASSNAIQITRRASPPLIRLLYSMDTWSDNFIAEMLLKQLGARISGHGTTIAGTRVVASTLAENLIPLQGVRLADGSGLSPLNRLTARTLAATLETIAHTTALHRLLDTFAIAGATGTLRHRLLNIPNHQLVTRKDRHHRPLLRTRRLRRIKIRVRHPLQRRTRRLVRSPPAPRPHRRSPPRRGRIASRSGLHPVV